MHRPIQLTKTTSSRRIWRSQAPWRRRRVPCSLSAMSTLVSLLLAAATTFGGSATWNLNPTTGDWNTATNWTPETVPNGPAETAVSRCLPDDWDLCCGTLTLK